MSLCVIAIVFGNNKSVCILYTKQLHYGFGGQSGIWWSSDQDTRTPWLVKDGVGILSPHWCLCNSLHLEPDWLCALSLRLWVTFSPALLLEYWSASVSTGFILTWGSIRDEVTREATLSDRRSSSETLRDAQHPQAMTSQWEKEWEKGQKRGREMIIDGVKRLQSKNVAEVDGKGSGVPETSFYTLT